MANSVYVINKGINKSIEFKGLKAQYIWYLGGGMLILLVLFAILYIVGVSQYICLVIVLAAGAGLVYKIYELSNKYGEHGMMKMMAKRSVPKLVKSNSRRGFINLKNENHGSGK
ncbi:DUF4133 domain-containing protein [Pedobacter sp.]|jgi:4-hydroxybenzoate polyprenyltransferase|uniref:DUF4133 domain-containing protein n=1 Tax=Pedobacter sp. TaxID=1411316 RepID=UPI002C576D81|nr:DUF4133 domain-containing protein [Pedobacter sp.]HWW38146.1 DUF4133 domain-containing protein [Pedobacter sp.]